MNLIIETDIGRDPDDFFALCYLVSAGVSVRAITVSPGDKDQIAVVKFLCKELGLDIPVGAGDTTRSKSSATGMHTTLLSKYQHPLRVQEDGDGRDVIVETMKKYPDCEAFAIGPLQSLGRYLKEPANKIAKVTMQGGFVGYDTHQHPVVRLSKFEGLSTVSTFNMGGDVPGILTLLGREDVERKFIGKNVCHTVEYGLEQHKQVLAVPSRNRAMELFREGMTLYLQKHQVKLFHDPTAAVCMLHPDIGTWVNGKLYRDKGQFGTNVGDHPDRMLVNVDYEKLWYYLAQGE